MASDFKAGYATVAVRADDTEMAAGLRKASARLSEFASQVKSAAVPLAAFAAGITAPLGLAVRQFMSMGDALDKAAARTGISVEALSVLQFSAARSGASLEELQVGIKTMQKGLTDAASGTGQAVGALDALGLSLSTVEGHTPEAQFETIAAALRGIEDPTRRSAIAMRLFGESGPKLLPLIENLDALKARAKELGVEWTADQAAAAAALMGTWEDIKLTAGALASEIGVALTPALRTVGQAFVGGIKWAADFAKNHRMVIGTIAGVGLVASALASALAGVAAAAKGIQLVVAGIQAMGTVADSSRAAIKALSEVLAKRAAARAAAEAGGALVGSAGGAAVGTLVAGGVSGTAAATAAGTSAGAATAATGVLAGISAAAVGAAAAVAAVGGAVGYWFGEATGATDSLAKAFYDLGWFESTAARVARETSDQQLKHLNKRIKKIKEVTAETEAANKAGLYGSEISREPPVLNARGVISALHAARKRVDTSKEISAIRSQETRLSSSADDEAFARRLRVDPSAALSEAVAGQDSARMHLSSRLVFAQNASANAQALPTERNRAVAEEANRQLESAADQFKRWDDRLKSANSAVSDSAQAASERESEERSQREELNARIASAREQAERDMADRRMEAERTALSRLAETDPASAREEYAARIVAAARDVQDFEKALTAANKAFADTPTETNARAVEMLTQHLLDARAVVDGWAQEIQGTVGASARERSASIAGTFNASVAAQLGVGDTAVAERTAKATERSASILEQLLEQGYNTGTIFG